MNGAGYHFSQISPTRASVAINAPSFTPNSATGKWELMLLKRRFARRQQSRPSGDHRQVAFAIQLAAHCTFPSPSFGGQGVLSYPPYKKCRASQALVPTDSQKSANRIHTSEGLKLRSWSPKQSPLSCRIPFNDSTISTVIGVFSFH